MKISISANKKRIDAVVQVLVEKLYGGTFGGKIKGRFRIGKQDFKEFLGVDTISSADINALHKACMDEGLAMIVFTSYFCFMEAEKATAWRAPPRALLTECIKQIEELSK